MEKTRFQTIISLFFLSTLFCSCASRYNLIEPDKANYISFSEHRGIQLEYKYDVLTKKYEKKAIRKGIQVLAVKLRNNTQQDIKLGADVRLYYENGQEIVPIDNQTVFTNLKQSVAPYLLYLILTPANLYVYDQRGRITSSTPVGLILGPGLAGLNMGKAISGNEKFEQELLDFDINGSIIKAGETKYGLIGIRSKTFDAIKIEAY